MNKLRGEPFFFYYNLLILIIVIGAFGSNALANPTHLPPISSILIVHGISMLSWYVLVVVQTILIRKKHTSIHMALGKYSVAIAFVIVISGIMFSLDNYFRTSSIQVVTVNLFIIINFITLYTLAITRRRYPDKHKRLILFASIAMLIPALARITRIAGIDEFISILFWLILMSIPVLYDITTLRRVHRATIFGFVLLIITLTLTITLMDSSIWSNFLKSAIGQV